MNLLLDYKQITKDLGATSKLVAAQPAIKRQAEDYLANIVKVKSVDDFMKNDKVYRFALAAFGLKEMTYAKGFIRKALTEGIDDPKSFTVRLADSRFHEFVEAFNFARYGTVTTSFDRTQQGTVDRYVRTSLEEQVGGQDERLRLALYFKRKASNINSAYSILADKALYTVVRTAVGIPVAVSGSDIDRQAGIIAAKIKIEDFQNPEKLDKFLTKYLARAAADGNSFSTGATSPAVAILVGATSTVDMSTLLSIQTLRRYNS